MDRNQIVFELRLLAGKVRPDHRHVAQLLDVVSIAVLTGFELSMVRLARPLVEAVQRQYMQRKNRKSAPAC